MGAKPGLQRLWAHPEACEVWGWTLLFLAKGSLAVAQQLGAQFSLLLPPACPSSPISSPSHALLSPPSPCRAHPFLSRPGLFCLWAFAQIAPSTGVHTPSAWKRQAAHCREGQLLLSWSLTAPGVSLPLCNTVPTTLDCDWFSVSQPHT